MKKKLSNIKINISLQITLVLLVFNVVLSFIVGFLYNVLSEELEMQGYTDNMERICSILANVTDGDTLDMMRDTNAYDADMLKKLAAIYEEINVEKQAMDIFIFYPNEKSPHLFYMITDDMIDEAGNVNLHMVNDILAELNPEYDAYDKAVVLPLMLGDNPEAGSDLLTGEYYRDRVSEAEYAANSDGKSYVAWCPIFNSKNELAGVIELYGLMNDYIQRTKDTARKIQIMITAFFVVATFFAGRLVKRAVVKKIQMLEKYVTSYENNEFKEKKPEFKSQDEISALLESFVRMNEKVDNYQAELVEMTADSAKMKTELQVAEGIQNAMLVTDFPAFPEYPQFMLHASMDAAANVGGDFYDFFKIDDEHIALIVADVSGGNVSGAMFMMRSIVSLRTKAMAKLDPSAILHEVNNDLCNRNSEQMFVTVWIGILEVGTGKLVCSNGGHECPAISRNGGVFELMDDRHGFVLGGLEDMKYENYEVQLEPGDIIFQYSDGVTEANDSKGKLFGNDRMISVLTEHRESNPEQLIHFMRERLKQYAGGVEQSDDITMLCIKYLG